MILKDLKDKAFTLVETMMAVAILLIVIMVAYAAMTIGRSTWSDSDSSVELQQSLRFTLDRVTRELQESGFDKNGTWQVSVSVGTGFNSSDVLTFSIPIICHSGDGVIDTNGDVAYWGAPLTWGCTTSSCMDADNDCNTRDYKFIRYAIDSSNQLIRTVLDPNNVVMRQESLAKNIINFKVTNSVDQNVVTLQISAQKNSALNRVIQASSTMNVYLRN